MKKLIILIVILIITLPVVIFYSGKQAIKSRTGDTVYDKIAQKIPDTLKRKIKEKIFTSDHLRQEIYLKDKLIRELEIKENVAIIRLNRPDVKNALNTQMRAEITQCVNQTGKEARVVVITGSGSAFCSLCVTASI